MQKRANAQLLERRREKARWIEGGLTEFYGPRPYVAAAYDSDLVGALIATILSQHTSDLNSGRAFLSIKKRYTEGWETLRTAPVDEIADSIRSGGLADVKAARIKRLLNDIHARVGVTDLEILRDIDSDAARLEFLKSFHGVGPKTAACVLCFNMGRPVIPVDTHVHRVSGRLGLIGPKTSADQAHNDLLELLPPDSAYSFHVHLIEHGRQICRARRPECAVCPVRERCDYYQGSAHAARSGTEPQRDSS